MKARDLIKRSLILIGALAHGETPQASELSDALDSLNNMLAGWKLSPNIMAERSRQVIPIVTNKAFYTMGVGGDFDFPRPDRINYISYLSSGGTQDLERPLEILNQQEYSQIGSKAISGSMAQSVYIEYSYPLIKIYLWPVSDGSGSLAIYTDALVSKFTNASNEILLPDYYLEAMEYNLAKRLCSAYGKSMDQDSNEIAIKSLAQIRRSNHSPLIMTPDGSGSGKRFNILTGE